jgi:tetratricopeptide (TPR) repeat protein
MVWLFLIALALRVAHILAMRRSPYFVHPIIDALTYHDAARSIAAGHGHPDAVFWQPPGYSYILASFYAITGPTDLLVPRIVQALLGAAAAVLTAWIGARRFGPRVGLAAGFIVALYGTLIYFDGELLGVSFTVALQLIAVALAVAASDAARPGRFWFGAGFTAGVASLVTAPTLVFVAVFAAFARRHAHLVVLAAAIAIAPVTIRNAVKGGEIVLISTNAGINLYLGNNPRYDETVQIRPDRHWTELTKEPYDRGIRTKSGGSNYFAGRAFEWARKEPIDFLRLQIKKLRLLLGGDEIFRNQAIYPSRQYSPVLSALLWKVPGLAFPFGLLAPLALLGMVVAWKRAPLLACVVASYVLAVVAFFVAARYRVPLVPYLAIFAAGAVRWFVSAVPARKAAAAAGVVAVTAACNLGQGRMSMRMNADAEYSLAAQLQAEGRSDEAEAHYKNALEDRPDYTEAWVNLGVLEASRGNGVEAARAFEEGLRLNPKDATALINLAALREREHRWEEAIQLYQRAALLNPGDEVPAKRIAYIRGLPPGR